MWPMIHFVRTFRNVTVSRTNLSMCGGYFITANNNNHYIIAVHRTAICVWKCCCLSSKKTWITIINNQYSQSSSTNCDPFFSFPLIIFRSNSKASYLPRQSHEKLASDPDHGSYKLTLTSNEDCIHLPHNVFHDPIHTTKINNLPDVLPLGVKMQNVPMRYGSNQNLKSSPNGHKTPPASNDHHQSPSPLPPSTPQQQKQHLSSTATSPITSAYSLKSMFTFHSNNNKQRNSIDHNILTMSNNNINQMHMNANGPNAGDAMSPTNKFMSQSTIDLKKAQLMFTHEAIFQQQQQQQQKNGVNTRITATESMGNLIDCTNRQSAPPFLLHHQQQQNSSGRKSSAFIDSDMANHIAMNSNGLTSNGNSDIDDRINRTDSLKENIDTITQLQAKLMSTQLHDNSASDFGHDSIADATIPEDDSLSTDDTSSVSQLSSESLTSNDINEILDAEGIDAAQPSLPTSAAPQCQTESQYDDAEEAQTSIDVKLNETTMSDVGSQTDESILDSFSHTTNGNANGLPTKTVIVTRSRFADEFDCEKLTDDLIQQLSPNDRLRHILGKFSSNQSAQNGGILIDFRFLSLTFCSSKGVQVHW